MATETESRQLRLVNPISEPVSAGGFEYAPRLRDLRGARVGIIDDSKRGAEELLREVYRVLDAEYGFSSLCYHRKPSASRPVDPKVLQEMAGQCDFVIVGVGD